MTASATSNIPVKKGQTANFLAEFGVSFDNTGKIDTSSMANVFDKLFEGLGPIGDWLRSMMSAVMGDEVEYGASVLAGDALDDKISVYTMDSKGILSLHGEKDSMDLADIKAKLGDDLEVRRVEVGGDTQAYFVHNKDGNGYYIGNDDFNVAELPDGVRKKFIEEYEPKAEIKTPAPNAAPVVAADATVGLPEYTQAAPT